MLNTRMSGGMRFASLMRLAHCINIAVTHMWRAESSKCFITPLRGFLVLVNFLPHYFELSAIYGIRRTESTGKVGLLMQK